MYNNSFELVFSFNVNGTDFTYLVNYAEDTAIRLVESNGARTFEWFDADEIGDHFCADLLDFEEGRDFARVISEDVSQDLADNGITGCTDEKSDAIIQALKDSLEF